jgi:hypothetical protein
VLEEAVEEGVPIPGVMGPIPVSGVAA